MNKNLSSFLLLCIFFHFNCSAQTDQTLVYSSYFGGSGSETASRNVLDTRVDHWLSGDITSSSNMPFTNNAFQSSLNGEVDIFISIFQDLNTLTYASYFGGSNNEYSSSVQFMPGINGFVIAGFTTSTDFPVTSDAYLQEHQGGGEDGFIARFSEDGQLLWSTYFGGSEYDRIENMSVDAFGFIYVVGRTASANLATNGVHQTEINGGDAFLAKFDSDGILMWSTYFGGSGDDRFSCIGVSPDGNTIYCSGSTNSDSNIAVNGFQNVYGGLVDGTIACFNSSNGTLNWSSYYGGEEYDKIDDLIVEDDGSIYFSGETRSSSGITSSNAHQENFAGFSDNFLVRFSSEGDREWGTYYGGDNTEGFSGLTSQYNNILLYGSSNSQNNIVYGNPFDAGSSFTSSYMAKFNPSGEVIWGSHFISDPPISIRAFKAIPGSSKMVAIGGVWEGVNMSEFITSDAYQEYNAGEDDLIYFVFEDNTLSAKTHNINPLKVYPNPATDMVTIERPENLTGDLNLEIFDAMGKLVLRKSLNTWSIGVNVSKLTAGAYILKINTEEEIYRTKLIVE
ncbi:T9SS type A sorting domain-containing protein [Cryomorpha ignava]|uniref:T9SS type A sorting domain-containing protein n=1 Tax=Cryomorpha ignava TaxID=101383 RepID=A0A7K3WVS7_9FLAO|nr:T9SS type A sorting domain-containing protein [Cryomorpha ignava]NEN24705.1 T9SS type A sorting domain-containing protein [Cryomorpha ignava]